MIAPRVRVRRAATAAALAAFGILLAATPAFGAYVQYDRNGIRNGFLRLDPAGWRAGSGQVQDACQVGRGWLPTGWYDSRGHWNNYDATIKGRVFWISDKQCQYGTWRTELFIHTEETSTTGQYCPTAGDDPYCWEGDFDYESNGCIKIKQPNYDMYNFHNWWHNKFGNIHGDYPNINNNLWVNGV
jgi:hypothetical protein